MKEKLFSLKKEERIHSREEIQGLFSEADSFVSFPFKVLHLEQLEQGDEALKFAVSVPKRSFKKAVDRNLLKRRIKEAYRLNKNELKISLTEQGKSLNFMVIYIAKEALDFHLIEKKIILTLRRLQSLYAKDSE